MIVSTNPADVMLRDPGYARDLELLRARDLQMQADGSLSGYVGGYRPWQVVYKGWVNARGPVIEALTWVQLPDVYYALRRNADYSPKGARARRLTFRSRCESMRCRPSSRRRMQAAKVAALGNLTSRPEVDVDAGDDPEDHAGVEDLPEAEALARRRVLFLRDRAVGSPASCSGDAFFVTALTTKISTQVNTNSRKLKYSQLISTKAWTRPGHSMSYISCVACNTRRNMPTTNPVTMPIRPEFGVTPREKMPSMKTAAIEGASSDCTSCR